MACLLLVPALRANTVAEVEALMRNGEAAAALTRAEVALQQSPRDAPLRFLKAVLLADLQREDEALAIYRGLSEEFPDLSEPFNNMAVLLAGRGQLDAAREALEQALRNNPAHVLARENLGDVYLRLAIQQWESAAGSPKAPGSQLQRKLRQARELLQGNSPRGGSAAG